MSSLSRVCPILCLAGLLLSAERLRAADEELEDTAVPGLVARFQSAAAPEAGRPAHVVERIEPVPRLFAVGAGPQTVALGLPAEAAHVQWSGLLAVPFREQYVFTARRSTLAEFKFTLAGREVVLGQPVELAPGLVPLEISGIERSGTPAFQLWWRSGQFVDEPVEARHFRHDPAARIAPAGHELVDRGAVLAETHGCFRCHAGSDAWTASLGAGLAAGAELPGPRLERVGERLHPAWIAAQLLAPAPNNPMARMPRLFSDTPEDRLAAPDHRSVSDARNRNETGNCGGARPTREGQGALCGGRLCRLSRAVRKRLRRIGPSVTRSEAAELGSQMEAGRPRSILERSLGNTAAGTDAELRLFAGRGGRPGDISATARADRRRGTI